MTRPDAMPAWPGPSVSIVMPTLDEAGIIEAALGRLRADFPGCELVVADGGSLDGTPRLAASLATVVPSPPGRARQMNEGARHTTGEVLWFVHADAVVDRVALAEIHAVMADRSVIGGGLSLRFDRRSIGLDYLAWSSNQRARRLHWIFGDQSLFVRRQAFDDLGGFPDLPLMEDLELSRRLQRRGDLVLLEATSTASARRFVEHGTWRMIAFMQYLKILYFVGVDPFSISDRYATGPHLRTGRRARSLNRQPVLGRSLR